MLPPCTADVCRSLPCDPVNLENDYHMTTWLTVTYPHISSMLIFVTVTNLRSTRGLDKNSKIQGPDLKILVSTRSKVHLSNPGFNLIESF